MNIQKMYFNKDFELFTRSVNSESIFMMGANGAFKRIFIYSEKDSREEKECLFVDPIHELYYDFKKEKKKHGFSIVVPNSFISYLPKGQYFTLSNFKGENWFYVTDIDIASTEGSRVTYNRIYFERLEIQKFKPARKKKRSGQLIMPLNQFDQGYSNEELFELINNFTPIELKYKELKNINL